MAMFIEGMKCPLCGKPMFLSERIKMLPPFTGNREDPIWFLSDSAVHESCFNTSPLAKQVNERLYQLGFKADK